jgi:hypothetical protein
MVYVLTRGAQTSQHAIMIFLRVAITLPALTPAVLTHLPVTSMKVLLVMMARVNMVAAPSPGLVTMTHKRVVMMAHVHSQVARHLTRAITM